MEKDIVIIKGYRDTRRKVKLFAALDGELMQDYLKVLIDQKYEKSFRMGNKSK